jgi:hypothetical protein
MKLVKRVMATPQFLAAYKVLCGAFHSAQIDYEDSKRQLDPEVKKRVEQQMHKLALGILRDWLELGFSHVAIVDAPVVPQFFNRPPQQKDMYKVKTDPFTGKTRVQVFNLQLAQDALLLTEIPFVSPTPSGRLRSSAVTAGPAYKQMMQSMLRDQSRLSATRFPTIALEKLPETAGASADTRTASRVQDFQNTLTVMRARAAHNAGGGSRVNIHDDMWMQPEDNEDAITKMGPDMSVLDTGSVILPDGSQMNAVFAPTGWRMHQAQEPARDTSSAYQIFNETVAMTIGVDVSEFTDAGSRNQHARAAAEQKRRELHRTIRGALIVALQELLDVTVNGMAEGVKSKEPRASDRLVITLPPPMDATTSDIIMMVSHDILCRRDAHRLFAERFHFVDTKPPPIARELEKAQQGATGEAAAGGSRGPRSRPSASRGRNGRNEDDENDEEDDEDDEEDDDRRSRGRRNARGGRERSRSRERSPARNSRGKKKGRD